MRQKKTPQRSWVRQTSSRIGKTNYYIQIIKVIKPTEDTKNIQQTSYMRILNFNLVEFEKNIPGDRKYCIQFRPLYICWPKPCLLSTIEPGNLADAGGVMDSRFR